MGFLLASFGLAAIFGTLLVFRHFYDGDWTGLYEAITGFGLGGSAIALFGRVGGGLGQGCHAVSSEKQEKLAVRQT